MYIGDIFDYIENNIFLLIKQISLSFDRSIFDTYCFTSKYLKTLKSQIVELCLSPVENIT